MPTSYPQEIKDQVLSMVREGFTYAAIAEHFEINVSTICSWVAAIDSRKRTPYVETDPNTGSVVYR